MKWIRTIVLLGFSLSFFPACEREVDLNLGESNPEVVVLANFSDLDTLEVVVSKSRSVLDQGPMEAIPDAVVELYVDDFFADRLGFVPSPIPQIPGYYYSTDVVPQAGERLRLTVDALGFDPVEGECTMPFPVEIDTGYTALRIEIEELDLFYNQANITVDIKVLDPSNISNYYHLNFYMQGFDFRIDTEGDTLKTAFYSLPLSIFSNDDAIPLVPYIDDRGVLFTDDALEANHGKLSFHGTFQYRRSDQLLGDFLIELRATSPEYYLYHSSLARQYQASQDPFSEPVILYSNIDNGQGIFAAFLSRFYRVETAQ
ncbi:MAG: DUF4249 domain-containing protein [Saprospirales bacterium]|nr:DUF4249 domain-containing protein [Saprospirales bacterium]